MSDPAQAPTGPTPTGDVTHSEDVNATSAAREAPPTASSGYASLISGIGYVLAASYPVLALSTGVRALYQIFLKDGVVLELHSVLSLVAALIYVVAAFGFAYRRPWTWWLSLGALALEAALVLIVGTWSVIDPATVGRTVWRNYGEDYGYFPLIQPLIGLVWLLWPGTYALFHVRGGAQAAQDGDAAHGVATPLP